jgi:site-specific DNA-methyltransferase (adenine-specific)
MLIQLKDIFVEEKRQRIDYGNIDRLADGMKRVGQVQAILVEEGLFPGEKKYKLIAGGRRLRAAALNGWNQIEAITTKDCDPIRLEEMELEENINRKDLTWGEEIEATRKLDELKRKIHGDASNSGSVKTGWSSEDTAELLNKSVSSVNQDIQLANALKDNPILLKRIKNLPKNAARKIMLQEEAVSKLRKLQEIKGIEVGVDLRKGKSEELIDSLEDNSVHLWLTDPPFAVAEIASVSLMGTYNTTTSNVSDEQTMLKCYETLIPKVYQKLVDGAHIYVFFGFSWYTKLINLLRSAGFIVDDIPIIWDKMRQTVMPKDLHYCSSYCPILFGHKPPANRILRKPGRNLISIPMVSPNSRIHGLELPEELLKIFIDNSSDVGETVLDTFAGSGIVLSTAKKMQRSAIGFELDDNNYIQALQNIKERLEEKND